ncbi:MAG TPA: MFS transporter, partial [Pilimelia sp.]|nr:MFS transporter [Pilimelia sp.]
FLFIYLNDVRGLSGATVGVAVGWLGAVSLVLSPLGGTLVDRWGARRVLLPALLVESVGVASLALVTQTWQVFAAVTAIGTGFSVIYAAQSTILSSLTDEDERQHVFGLNFALLNLGIGLGGLVSGAVVDVSRPVTFQAIYVLDALSYLGPVIILLSMPAVGRRLVEPGAPPPRGARPVGAPQPPVGYRTVLRDAPFRRLVLFGLTLTTFGYAQIEIGFTAFATEVAQVTPRIVGWALAANTLIIVSVQLLVLRWLRGRSRTAALAGAGGLFAAAWLTLGGAGLAGGRSAAVAVAGVVGCAMIFAVGETLLSPVMPALVNALATDELRGRYNAVSSMTWGVSGVVGPITAGPLIGAGLGHAWVVLVVLGSVTAAGLALGLRALLTPAQDGRAAAAGGEAVRLTSTV